MEKDKAIVKKINDEVTEQLSDDGVKRALIATTFQGLTELSMKQAIVEGMIRGFKFKDFLEKNIYAIPFAKGYSLITSIDFARKRGMKSGVVGKSAPVFTMDGDKIESCSITIKRMVEGHVGEFTATVFFDEYNKPNRDIWKTKPRTMIAKVAEMHALRMACPEELSQAYIEEEMESSISPQARTEDALLNSKGLAMGNLAVNKTKNYEKEKDNDSQKAEQASGGQEGEEEQGE